MQNAGLNETQAGITIAGISINNIRYAYDTTRRRTQHLLTKVLEESEKVGL